MMIMSSLCWDTSPHGQWLAHSHKPTCLASQQQKFEFAHHNQFNCGSPWCAARKLELDFTPQKKTTLYFSKCFFLPILNDCDCFTVYLICLIYCKFCNFFYKEQTNTIKDRLYFHINDIKNLKPFSEKTTSVSVLSKLQSRDY